MRLFVLLTLLFLTTSCTTRWAPGYLIDSNGEVLSSNDTNFRLVTIQNIVSELDAQIGPHWRSEATIAELPIYDTLRNDSGWFWEKATVNVTLIGEGVGNTTVDADAVTNAVREFMSARVEKPRDNLSVTTSSVVDSERFKKADVELVDKPAAETSSEDRRYTVQEGDTYADLALAFYGTTERWKVIAEANKRIELKPGTTIIIPALKNK